MKATLNLIALRLWNALKREDGQDLIEYALLVGFLALSVVAAIEPIGGYIYQYYLYLNGSLKASLPGMF